MKGSALVGAGIACAPWLVVPALAQTAPAEPAAPAPQQEVVVVGTRGTVQTDLAPIATIDASTIAATGATSIDELLRTIRGLTRSADGADPIFLLNAQRVSGYSDIGSLPPEAIDKVEVLPEPAALRYGYPPTRRVVNFITKRRFRQLGIRDAVGTSTDGGADTTNLHLDLTRLAGDARLTLNGDYKHTDPLFQSERRIAPDPDFLFDAVGNVTGIGGGEVTPALSAAAGQPVAVAPVPLDPSRRGLADFAAGANRPRLFDLGPYRTLTPATDTGKIEAVLANRIGAHLAGSVTLTAEQSHERSLSDLAPATLSIAGSNPFSPFGNDVLLQRYLVEAGPLHLRQTTTTLHAGAVIRGAVAGWQWDATIAIDQQRIAGRAERAIDTDPAQAAIAAGVNPFAPLAPSLVAERLIDTGFQRTRTAGAKTVVSGSPLRVPAGPVQVTATAEVERSSALSRTVGLSPFALSLGRLRVEGAVSLDLPIASRREGFLAPLGELSLNGSANLRHVGGFGTLADTTYGASWAPITGVQFLAQVKHTQTAPSIADQSTPAITAPNASVFDATIGRSTLVTLFTGGNPDLRAEHRRTTSLTVNLKPFATREWRLGLTWTDALIRDEVLTIYALTPLTEARLPFQFVRDAAGQLTSASFRPLNIPEERQRSLNLTLGTSGQLGRARNGADGKPAPRTSYYGGIGPTLRLRDRLLLDVGTAPLDLLAGDTTTGGATARIAGYGYGGISFLGTGMRFDFWSEGAGRALGGTPTGDLRFGAYTKLNLAGFVSVHHFFPHQAWTSKFQIKLEAGNVTGGRRRVTDATGAVPARFQRDYLEPVGRTLTLSLRKLF